MPLPARSTPPIIPMYRHAPDETDPRLEIIRLKKDNASHRLRTRAYRRAVEELQHGATLPLTSAATAGMKGSLAALLAMAQVGERHGRAPVIRWTRDENDRINGVELCFITPNPDEEMHLDTLPEGMACIAGEED